MAAADEQLAGQLGLPADVVKIHRNSKLTEGVHYTRSDGGRIEYTPEGIAATKAALEPEKKEGPPLEPPCPTEKKEGPPPAPGKAMLVKLLRRYPNPIWIDIQIGNKRVQVKVRNNNLLSPDKRVLCRQWPDGRWECCQRGQAVPLEPLASNETQTGAATE